MICKSVGVRRMSADKTEKREEERSVSAGKIYKNRMRMSIFNEKSNPPAMLGRME